MNIDTYHQDGYLQWTALHRAARLNQLLFARQALELGADPNLIVNVDENPVIDSHGAHDEWLQSMCYAGKTSLDLARTIFGENEDFTEMRDLLRSFGAKTSDELSQQI